MAGAMDDFALSADETAQIEKMRAADMQQDPNEGIDAPEDQGDQVEDSEQQGSGEEGQDAAGDGQDAPEQQPRGDLRAALREERERRRSHEADLQRAQETIRNMEARFDQVVQHFLAKDRGTTPAPASQQPAAPRRNIPAYDTDPIGHLKATIEELTEQLHGQQSASQQQQQQQAQYTEQQTRFQNFVAAVEAAEEQFKATAPDYSDAVTFLKQSRDAELKAVGYANPAIRRQIIQQEIVAFANDMLSGNTNPAKGFYELAKLRGYQRSTPSAPAKPADKLPIIAKGQAKNRVGGTETQPPAKGGRPTLQDLTAMPIEEMAKNWDKFWQGR